MGRSGSRRKGPRFVRKRSSIHGYGVFARLPIAKGERLIEYKGALINAREAENRYPEIGSPPHTFLFDAGDDLYIDAGVHGNLARFINHSCRPNCDTTHDGRRIYIEAIRAIRPGEELCYDYMITLDEPHTPRARKKWRCGCGASNCRGTMLGKKR